MFNTTQHITNHPKELIATVTEVRAPTDESIRIYDDLCDKIRAKIVRSLKVENTVISVNGTVFETNLMDMVFQYKLVINGYELIDSVKIDIYEAKNDRFVMQKVVRKLSEQITNNLLKCF